MGAVRSVPSAPEDAELVEVDPSPPQAQTSLIFRVRRPRGAAASEDNSLLFGGRRAPAARGRIDK